jgi:uncharacterized protein (DUF433 family)
VFERIAVDSQICSGKPCIRGTRIMVKNILGLVAGGYDLEKILKTYPELEEADIRQALDYAAFVVDDERVITGA